MSGDGLVFIERERGRFAQSLVRERGKKTQKVVSSSLLFFNGERDCLVGILASLCLSINFILFNFILVYLFPVCSTRHWKTVLGDLGVDF